MLWKLAIAIFVLAAITTAFLLMPGVDKASFELGIQFERRTLAIPRATSLISAYEGIEKSRVVVNPQQLKDIDLAQQTLSTLIDEQILNYAISDTALSTAKLSTEMQTLLREMESSEKLLLQEVFDFRLDYPSSNPAIHKALNKIVDDLK